ncbi:PP2C family serine/threonine-protein phosphatase [Leadbetterella sp. DM7]|uniref:PP2C family serine/threonine-protein phosphatase n=1 Tax=Leadbetterella sp. DM7 TaxID=3235085 RepID=UPI00349EE4BA
MEALLKQILVEKNIEPNKVVNNTITKLRDNAKIAELAKGISDFKNQIIEIFDMYREKEEFKEKHLAIINATAKKEYEFAIDLQEFPNIVIEKILNLETIGLQFDSERNRIYGTPTVANTIDLHIVFYNKTDINRSEDIKTVPFIVNADPKDLWLNKASDQNAKYSKPDEDVYKGTFLDKKIVIASQRGRSHAHEGNFRDDDFKVNQLLDGWAVVAVADGAGSAKYARHGSKLATEYISERFNNETILAELNQSVTAYFAEKEITSETETTEKEQSETAPAQDDKLKHKSAIINVLYKKVLHIHNELKTFSEQHEIAFKDLNTTLIFALCKKFDFGYVVLTFGVGDCPINVIEKDCQTVSLLNKLDVGEFGGGTRFITMPEIFTPEIVNRFSVNKFENFSKLFLMTDGIYDPKFVTENKLEDVETWQNFLKDLDGENEDNAKVDFVQDENIDKQLLKWLDFWSKGNHDDRTLAIIY